MEQKKDKMKKEFILLLNDFSSPLPSLNFKQLSRGKRGTGGRNNFGRITIRRRGGGHKRRMYKVDYNGSIGKFTTWKIKEFIYNPNSSSHKLALCQSEGGRLKLLPYVDNMTLFSSPSYENIGDLRVGTICNNIERKPGKGGKLVRAAGVSATIIKKEGDLVQIKLPSGKIIEVLKECKVLRGRIGNEEHRNRNLGKAGRNRWLGKRPRVRGEAMNAVDHPHGGKSSRSGGLGKPFKNIWGKLAKWSKKN